LSDSTFSSAARIANDAHRRQRADLDTRRHGVVHIEHILRKTSGDVVGAGFVENDVGVNPDFLSRQQRDSLLGGMSPVDQEADFHIAAGDLGEVADTGEDAHRMLR